MKKLIIGFVLGMMAIVGCGDEDEPKAGLCEMCNQGSDCKSDLSCDKLYNLETNLPVGEYCIDGPTRVCEIGGDLLGLDSQPIAAASADLTSGYAPLTVNFTGSVSEGNAPFTYEWDFGDSETSTEQNPAHTYGAAGAFTVVFTVKDADGDSDSSSVGIEAARLAIELTIDPATISADDSVASTVTITANATGGGNVQEGKEVSFEVTAKPIGSLASVDPATDITDNNGEATTTLSAGTVIGEITVNGTAGGVTAEATVTVTAGTPAGIKAKEVNPISVITCPTTGFTFTAQLVDAFGNNVGQAGVSVTFSTDNGTLATPTVTTDDSGQATAFLILTGGVTAEVEATYANTVIFDPVTGGDPLVIPPSAGEIVSEGLPGFRTKTAIIDTNTISNRLGLISILVNEDLNGAVENGTINLLFSARLLVQVTGTNDIMFVGFTGLCGAPGTDTAACTGTETNYFIDPASLDGCGYPLMFAKSAVIDGGLLAALPEITLGFPAGGDVIELKLCGVEIKGTVTMDPWAIAGDRIVDPYCPGGCASLSGFLSKSELCKLVDLALGPGMCGLAVALLGNPDGECSGEEAYSLRMLFRANEVTLYEAP
ncbi:MAG: PKD domain-containing protein [Deltaproteobacteria bacterium]|nr:MAG: PKD domain-containing protein [Deltaproteobacteria bacterium]